MLACTTRPAATTAYCWCLVVLALLFEQIGRGSCSVRNGKYNVTIVGATGAVGQQILRLLEKRKFPIQQLKLLASVQSAGTCTSFDSHKIVVQEATPNSFKNTDIALFSAGTAVSKAFVPCAVEHGAVCIDNTNAYRMDHQVPLVVPEVNGDKLREHKGIIANPNCSTIQMVMAMKPLHDRYGIKKVIVSTYQAVSGAGTRALQELNEQTEALCHKKTPQPKILPVRSSSVKYQIERNVIPQVDSFESNGYTLEEMKMIRETKKIMADDQIQVTATCVRVPVDYSHCESVYIELISDYKLEDVRQLLHTSPGVVVIDNPSKQQYPVPIDATGKLDVFVGRIRRDLEYPRGLHLWIVSDNLLKGAAWNTVQIAEMIVH